MKFSIITINYNNAEGLCKTMDSVFSQNCTDYEFIVIDGGFTDNSVNFIQNGGVIFLFGVQNPIMASIMR